MCPNKFSTNLSSEESYNDNEIYSSFDFGSYEPLSVVHQIRGSILQRIKLKQPVLPDIDGREESKADIIRALLSGSHPYLVSEEGTGKTRLAKSLTGLLPAIPVIKGCPYHDDPKWSHELLCPRCAASNNPVKEYGIDFIAGEKRFSRIQGNEYTNEAKLLGLKDIQAIVGGKSPADPQIFIGTGAFRANRGVLFVDELPAIRTKVQVLFHPILEENKAILEEYQWEHPLDLIVVATGNPTGFSHVNDIPRPLLDRLETVYMDLPDEQIERDIMLTETFRIHSEQDNVTEKVTVPFVTFDDIKRKVGVPWWILEIVNRAVRHSRICPYVEKKASIRATIRSLDHTYASIEMETRQVANLRHAYHGLRLALRGRIELRADIIDFDNPKKTFNLGETLVEDFIWNVLEDLPNETGFLGDCNREKLGSELNSLISSEELPLASGKIPQAILVKYDEVNKAIQWMRKVSPEKVGSKLNNDLERVLYDTEDINIMEEFNYSAMEFLINICIHSGTLNNVKASQFFIPGKYKN